MSIFSSIKALFVSFWSGVRHLFKPRMTLRYPEQKLDLEGPGYTYDPKLGVGRPGFKGRHLLIEDKCTGCQLCAIACDGVAVAIEMQDVKLDRPHNKKNIWPAVDYGRCVFCGLCVDACPFDALAMTNEFELSAYDRAGLKFTPQMLFEPAKPTGTFKAKIDPKKGVVTHG